MSHRTPVLLFLLAGALALPGAVVPGRYIVELSSDSVVAHALKQGRRTALPDGEAASQRTRIRGEQKTLRGRIAQHGSVLDSTETVSNTLLVEVPDSKAADLAAMPGVRRVYPVRTMHMLLDRAVIVNKVVEAWNQVGFERAGSGVKIAIIDSGVDASHAGFQDSTLAVPDGFPKTTLASDITFTNSKVIVARSYVSLLSSRRDPDQSSRDRVGHGTALAMVAAGVRNTGPLATIAGVAPKAYIGNYKVFGTPGYNDGSTDSAILKAIDDAVADGMDIINLSLGDDLAPRLEDDPMVDAIERASKAGVIVVVAAGNNGPGLYRMSSPATAPSAIAVGASRNDRTFGTGVEVSGLPAVVAIPSSATVTATSITAPLADVAAIDGTGRACSALPAGSLTGKVALILRGDCTFETKLNLAKAAGAIGALVYAAADSPDPIAMGAGTATLPAEMIAYGDGASIKQAVASRGSITCTLRFTLSAIGIDSNRIADFSAFGPNVDAGIKPDLVAVGTDIYVATQKFDSNGDMYSSTGYVLVDGTSFSAPMVAGVAAILKSARPGLTVDQYRSLLINSASTVDYMPGVSAKVQQAGSGALNAGAALRSTVAAYPTALAFGSGTASPAVSRTLKLTNTGGSAETYTILVEPRQNSMAPAVATNTIQLAPGASADIAFQMSGTAMAAGAHEGFVRLVAATDGAEARIPYWYAVTSDIPSEISVLDAVTSARRNSSSRDAVLFRILDSAGLPLTGLQPQVSAVSGGGSVQSIVSYDRDVPGMYSLSVRLGPVTGTNVFRVQAGDAVAEILIVGQ